MATILIVDDEKAIRRSLKDILELEGYKVDEATNGEEALEKVANEVYDLILCDIKMPKVDGMEFLEKSREIIPDIPVIMISAHANVEIAVDAVRKGAYDFFTKPPELNRVLISIRNAIERADLVTETKVLRRKVTKVTEIIGESPSITKIKETIERVAPTDARVLITGDNGSGKELVARWIHEQSNRNKAPLIEVNCAAIPSELIESELFGHEKGSFTSAIKQKIGKFEQAHGGTLFLDEIGDMSLSAQAKVLRALQEHKITRVGGDKDISVNVRVVAATNKDLLTEIENKNFRMDLYHRLSVILIHVPTLNERLEDIPILAEKFVKEIADEYGMKKIVTQKAFEELKKINYTGNIRELRNIIERLVILSNDKITEKEVQQYAGSSRRETLHDIYERFSKLHDFKDYVEKQFIESKLKAHGWNIVKTSEEIDIQRSHLYNKIEKYNLKRD